ncbi:hypothetical protein QT327_21325 [Olivibacter sp. 47]|uniref:hypothetical protein n=1 Tax=Olivibacter sp. 47 TaxID=3056486 RepID=UPI0025A4778D|nr:hypothetical protein [Olivibacter sp. 47]MDM8176858.1 hypothetical protein [Olivibacter sp. 47]
MEDIIYNKVSNLLKDIPELRDIDLDYGQLDIYETRPALAFPCVLIDIEFPRTQSLDYDKEVQQITGIITLRIAVDVIGETAIRTPVLSRNNALERFALNNLVYKKLQRYRDKEGEFDRVSQVQEKRSDGYKVTNMKFETVFLDRSATSD